MAPSGEVALDIVRMGRHGEGVATWPDGRTAFVAGGLPGERVAASLTEEHTRYVRARAQRIVNASPDREAPPCPVYAKCGGCALQHWSYPAELASKRERVQEALRRIGKVADAPVAPVLGADDPYGYRNKGQFPWGMAAGRPVLGLFARGSHRLVPVVHCQIQDALVNRVLPVAEALARELGLPVYDESQGRGLLRHLLIRSSLSERRTLVLVVAAAWDPKLSQWARRLMEQVDSVAGVGFNRNPNPGNRVLGEETRTVEGSSHLTDKILGMTFQFSFTSFFQVNPVQVERLYRTALDAIPAGCEEVWDLYAGVGTLAALASTRAHRVRALESNPHAVRDARQNFVLNGLLHMEMEEGTAEKLLPQWARHHPVPEVILLDPPRSGLRPEVTAALCQIRAPRLVYVSCDPETMARDIGALSGSYRVESVVPVDMFPRTDHVESVAVLDVVE